MFKRIGILLVSFLLATAVPQDESYLYLPLVSKPPQPPPGFYQPQPPPGFYQPQRGFGLVWREQLVPNLLN